MILQEKLDDAPVCNDLFSELTEEDIKQCKIKDKKEIKCMWLSKHAKTYRARKRNYKRVEHWDDKYFR